jgi:hypothetical protein
VSARIEYKEHTDKVPWHLEFDQEKRKIVMLLATIPSRSYFVNRRDLAMVEVAEVVPEEELLAFSNG